MSASNTERASKALISTPGVNILHITRVDPCVNIDFGSCVKPTLGNSRHAHKRIGCSVPYKEISDSDIPRMYYILVIIRLIMSTHILPTDVHLHCTCVCITQTQTYPTLAKPSLEKLQHRRAPHHTQTQQQPKHVTITTENPLEKESESRRVVGHTRMSPEGRMGWSPVARTYRVAALKGTAG